MLLRFFQTLSFSFIVFFTMPGLPVPASSGVLAGTVQTSTHTGISGKLTCTLHHSAPRLKECERPYTRRTGQWNTSPSKKYSSADIALTGTLLPHETGKLSGQFNIAFHNTPGAPYNSHRARTGRQLN